MLRRLGWLFFVASMGILEACGTPEQPLAEQRASIEDDYLRILSELTQLMHGRGEPESVLVELRTYLATAKPRIAEVVKTLNREILTMDSGSRASWRRVARRRLEVSLDEFAQAQMALERRLNDAQKWELGEIFRTLQ